MFVTRMSVLLNTKAAVCESQTGYFDRYPVRLQIVNTAFTITKQAVYDS